MGCPRANARALVPAGTAARWADDRLCDSEGCNYFVDTRSFLANMERKGRGEILWDHNGPIWPVASCARDLYLGREEFSAILGA